MTKKKQQPNKKSGNRVVVFVYGTLKKGFPLHGWLNDSKYLGRDTVYGYTLINMGAYPALIGLVDENGEFDSKYKVTGELWSMPEEDFLGVKAMEERVGYVTMELTTSTDVEAAAFVFDYAQGGNVEWVKHPNQSRCGVAKIAPQPDDIPF